MAHLTTKISKGPVMDILDKVKATSICQGLIGQKVRSLCSSMNASLWAPIAYIVEKKIGNA